jgi:RNA polymerase sigma-70 factor, ECF subfamily
MVSSMSAPLPERISTGADVKGDSSVIAEIAAGRLDGLALLFDRYEKDVRRLIARLGVMPCDVDDLIQCTFLEVPRASAKYDGRCSARAWILGIAAMTVRRHRRSVARALRHAAEWFSSVALRQVESPVDSLEASRAHVSLQRALACMSPRKRETFLLVVVEGLSGEEVARALGIPVATVWTRLHHARREIRSYLVVREDAKPGEVREDAKPGEAGAP